jgi:hypothetical protein
MPAKGVGTSGDGYACWRVQKGPPVRFVGTSAVRKGKAFCGWWGASKIVPWAFCGDVTENWGAWTSV